MSILVLGTQSHGVLVEDEGNARRAFGPVFDDRDQAMCLLAWWTRYGPCRVELMPEMDATQLHAIIAGWRETPGCMDCGHPRGDQEGDDVDGVCVGCRTALRRRQQRGRLL
jgi:hypothetical protein